MTSGVYRLEFLDGSFYIGKSNNIERRWEEHAAKFEKGIAAKLMQAAYNRCGMPEGKVIWECHPDHIYIFESHFINAHCYNTKCLNGVIPPDPGVNKDYNFNQAILNMSTLQHIDMIDSLNNTIDEMERVYEKHIEEFEEEIEEMKDGTKISNLEEEISILKRTLLDEQNRRIELE